MEGSNKGLIMVYPIICREGLRKTPIALLLDKDVQQFELVQL
jgi:hypothetical protein